MLELKTIVCPVNLKGGVIGHYTFEEFNGRTFDRLYDAGQFENYDKAVDFFRSLSYKELESFCLDKKLSWKKYETYSDEEKMSLVCDRAIAIKMAC